MRKPKHLYGFTPRSFDSSCVKHICQPLGEGGRYHMHDPLFGCMCEGKIGPCFELWKEEKRIMVTNTATDIMNCTYHPEAKHWQKEHGLGDYDAADS